VFWYSFFGILFLRKRCALRVTIRKGSTIAMTWKE
jgi:hypothetical protein